MAKTSKRTQAPPQESLPPLKFIPAEDDVDVREAILQSVRPSAGYPSAVLLMADAVTKRADLVLMDFAANQVAVRYQVDGIWHTMPSLPRDTGDYLLATLKQLCSLDYRERRLKQNGKFTVEYMRQKHKCRFTSQGVPTGERVVMAIDRSKPPLENLEEIGMRPGMRKQLLEYLNNAGGLVLLSALPGDGLSTTWRAALQSTDRFLRDFFSVHEVSRGEPEIINVGEHTWDEAAGETMQSCLRSLLLREPNAIAFPEIGNGDDLTTMARLATEKQLTIVTRLHARHAAEAIVRALALKPDAKSFAEALQAVVCQRTIRKLCPDCRQGFRPNPAMLTQLGLPPERIQVLYRQFQPTKEDLVDERGQPVTLAPCETCSGLGFAERTGVFELLEITDEIRTVMKSQPTVAAMNEAVTRSGHVSLRDEGIIMVARGDTSLEELQRVLKK